jgi:hypothetical protein
MAVARPGRMPTDDELLPQPRHVPLVTTENDSFPTGPVATRDRDVIRRWAARRKAEPATGEATVSGPATADIQDGGAGIRFNFPALGRLRPNTWEEWFENFERHGLTFVYDAQSEADGSLSARYRIVKTEDWPGQIG